MKLGLFNLMTQRDASITQRQIVEDTDAMVKLADEIGFDVAMARAAKVLCGPAFGVAHFEEDHR